jgi:hypothetical protein
MTDGVDTVTYGVFTYKWKDLVDTLYFQKMKNPYMYYKLSGLVNTTPFIGSWEFGYGTPLKDANGNDMAWLAIVGTYKDTTSYTASNGSGYTYDNLGLTNGVTYTNGASLTSRTANNQNPLNRDTWNATIEGSLGFGFKAGDAVVNLQYYIQNVANYTKSFVSTVAADDFTTNGTLQSKGAKTDVTTDVNTGSQRHLFSFGIVSGVFELQGTARIDLLNNSMNNLVLSSNKAYTVGLEGTSRQSSLLASKVLGDGAAPLFASSANTINPATFLKNTQLYFDLSPRVQNIGDMKFYLLGSYATSIFDAATNNVTAYSTSAALYDTNSGAATNVSNTSFAVSYDKPTYSQIQGQLRMKKTWKEDKVSLGFYPRYYITSTSYGVGRQATSNVTLSADTNGDGAYTAAGETNYTRTWTGGIDRRQVDTLANQIRLPMAVNWAVSKNFTLYGGITGVFTHTLTTTTLTENAPSGTYGNLTGEYLSYTDSTSSALSQSVNARETVTKTVAPSFGIVGSYALGLLWKPSSKVELMVTFNKEKTFNLSGVASANDAGLFDGADLQFIYNF